MLYGSKPAHRQAARVMLRSLDIKKVHLCGLWKYTLLILIGKFKIVSVYPFEEFLPDWIRFPALRQVADAPGISALSMVRARNPSTISIQMHLLIPPSTIMQVPLTYPPISEAR